MLLVLVLGLTSPLTPGPAQAQGGGRTSLDVRLTPDLDEHTGINEAAGIQVRPSPGKGLGVFARRRFSANEVLGDYYGETLTAHQVDILYGKGPQTASERQWVEARRARGVTLTGSYVFKVAEDIFIGDMRECRTNAVHARLEVFDLMLCVCACVVYCRSRG